MLLHDLYWKSVLDDCEGAWSAEVEQRPEELNVVVKVRDNAHSRKLGWKIGNGGMMIEIQVRESFGDSFVVANFRVMVENTCVV